jgi:hypothetical protein
MLTEFCVVISLLTEKYIKWKVPDKDDIKNRSVPYYDNIFETFVCKLRGKGKTEGKVVAVLN